MKGEHGEDIGCFFFFFVKPLTLLEVERRAIPIGRKTMPISTKVPTTQFGVRMGCHAFKRCCLKGLSLGLFVAVDSAVDMFPIRKCWAGLAGAGPGPDRVPCPERGAELEAVSL